jgi:hypothetical protein
MKEQADILEDPLIKMEAPFDIQIETDQACGDYQVSLVFGQD